MKHLRALEAALVRAESAVAVTLVLVMLALAGYSVVYRNVLVPLQKHWAHSGPVEARTQPTVAATPTPDPTARPDGAAEGFGGDWGEDDGAPAEPAADDGAAEGFAGDWGEGGDPPAAEAKTPAPDGAADGFAGDWGEGGDEADAAVAVDPVADDDDDDDDEITKLARIDTTRADADGEVLGGPPPEGSFAARMVSLIDAVKMAWIDVVLRQLVIIVAFFGAMMATQRGKHINVDALSKLLGPAARRWLSVVTNGLATAVCIVFARAGADLVAINREHPRPLVPWADEWMFQLMFPLGFGLLAFHFAVQTVAVALGESPEGPAPTPAPAPAPSSEGGGAA